MSTTKERMIEEATKWAREDFAFLEQLITECRAANRVPMLPATDIFAAASELLKAAKALQTLGVDESPLLNPAATVPDEAKTQQQAPIARERWEV